MPFVLLSVALSARVAKSGCPQPRRRRVLMRVMRRGEWRFSGPRDRSGTTVGSGQFIIRHNGPPSRFEVEPRTRADVLILPASFLGPLIETARELFIVHGYAQVTMGHIARSAGVAT